MITEQDKDRMTTVAFNLAEHLLKTGGMRSEVKANGNDRMVEIRFARNDRSFPKKPDFVYASRTASANKRFQSHLIASVVILSIYLVGAQHIERKEALAVLLEIGAYDLKGAQSLSHRMLSLMSEIDYVFAAIVQMFELGLDALERKEAN